MLMMLPKPQRLNMVVAAVVDDDAAAADVDDDDEVQQRLQQPPTLMPMLPRPLHCLDLDVADAEVATDAAMPRLLLLMPMVP